MAGGHAEMKGDLNMKIRSVVASAVLAGALIVGGTACDIPTPCEGLTASEKDKQAAADGYEVEKEDSQGNTCELSQDGETWEEDD